MDSKMILYRGSLKSCNYSCSYCPFAKHPSSAREMEKDRMDWMKFCKSLEERAEDLGRFALMVVPYGEALIHPWYWEGLAFLSRLKQAEVVGVQTNFSFSAGQAGKLWREAKGRKEKLRLWATYHPEMVSPARFAKECREAAEEGIALCAGAVGVPENLSLIGELRRCLPDEIYLWINAMDGLKRAYTREEVQAFSAIDPFFIRELSAVPANFKNCRNRLFVEGNGKMQTCNISGRMPGNWYQEDFSFPSAVCRQKACSCYLAYGGRGDWVNTLLFGKYPLFRIPRYFPAVFLDIDGTLLQEGEREIDPLTAASLKVLKKMGTRLFFATSLPVPEAKKRCANVWELFDGGIFAVGAHLLWKEAGQKHGQMPRNKIRQKEAMHQEYQEILYPLDEAVLSAVKARYKSLHCRLYAYRNKGKLYKITLCRREGCGWERAEERFLQDVLPETRKGSVRFLREENCMQVIPAGASKENGVKIICQKIGISPKQAAAVGDSAEDESMLLLCSEGIKLQSIK